MTLLQTNSTVDSIVPVVLFGAAGAAFGTVKFFKGFDPESTFRPRQLGKTIAIWAIAGIVTSQSPGEFNQAAVAATTASIAPVVNALWDAYLPESLGGSPTHGTGATHR